MAVIPQNIRPFIRALNEDAVALAELKAATPNKDQLRALIQGLENWYEAPATRVAAKAAMEAEAGISVSNTFAKKIARVWMQLKWGNE